MVTLIALVGKRRRTSDKHKKNQGDAHETKLRRKRAKSRDKDKGQAQESGSCKRNRTKKKEYEKQWRYAKVVFTCVFLVSARGMGRQFSTIGICSCC